MAQILGPSAYMPKESLGQSLQRASQMKDASLAREDVLARRGAATATYGSPEAMYGQQMQEQQQARDMVATQSFLNLVADIEKTNGPKAGAYAYNSGRQGSEVLMRNLPDEYTGNKTYIHKDAQGNAVKGYVTKWDSDKLQDVHSYDFDIAPGALEAQQAAEAAEAEIDKYAAGGALYKATRENKKDFEGLEKVKNYRDATTKLNIIRGAYNRAENARLSGKLIPLGPTDQTLINTFNKMLDPGSVVRESEFARSAESLAWIEKLRAKYAKIGEGGVVTPAERAEILRLSEIFEAMSADGFNKLIDNNMEYYQKFGLDVNDVTGGRANVDKKVLASTILNEVKSTADTDLTQFDAGTKDGGIMDTLSDIWGGL
jgi:hypothetical protein